MIRIYLDTSVYNRPFDDQTQPRIGLETLAFATIMQLIEMGNHGLGHVFHITVRKPQ